MSNKHKKNCFVLPVFFLHSLCVQYQDPLPLFPARNITWEYLIGELVETLPMWHNNSHLSLPPLAMRAWSLEWPLDWLKTHLIYFLFLFQSQAVLCVGFFHADCVSASLIKIMSDTPGLLYFYSIESIAIHKFSVWRLEEWQNLNRIKDVFVNILFSPGDFLFYFFSKKQKLHKSSSFSCSCSPSLSLLVLNKDGNWNSFRGGLFDLRFLYFFLRFWFILRSFSLYRAREKEGNELFCLFDFIRIF